jgi:DNA-binding CsgD family transcriptional regulator
VLSARVGLERARAAVQALQTIALPAAILRQDGTATAVNALFEACAPRIALGAGDRLVFVNDSAQAIFLQALAALETQSSALTGRSIAVAGDSLQTPIVAHLLPLRRTACDIFSGATALLYVTPIAQKQAPPPDLLEALFDLTPAEAGVASLLVEGKSVDEIAGARGVMGNTIRMQLKSIFAKTGTHRQAELVKLLAIPSKVGTDHI